MDMKSIEKWIGSVSDLPGLGGCRLIKSDEQTELPYPVEAPLICFCREGTDRMSFLLGSEDDFFGSEKLRVTVITPEKQGGGHCEETALLLCRALLNNDAGRNICSVGVEGCRYDKTIFAYKVVMRFTLREHTGG